MSDVSPAVTFAMDLIAMMAIDEIASDADVSPSTVIPEFFSSHTGKMLLDDSLKLWWDGPSAVVASYNAEKGLP